MFKVFKDGRLPTRGTKYSACVDLYAREDVVIGAGETVLIPLGVCIDKKFLYSVVTGGDYDEDVKSFDTILKKGMKLDEFKAENYLQLMLRSSLSKQLIIANGVGVIDLDYKDEIMIRVHNPTAQEDLNRAGQGYRHGYRDVKIKKGDRVAQITLLEHKSYLFGIHTEDERTGGFGSTDKKDK